MCPSGSGNGTRNGPSMTSLVASTLHLQSNPVDSAIWARDLIENARAPSRYRSATLLSQARRVSCLAQRIALLVHPGRPAVFPQKSNAM